MLTPNFVQCLKVKSKVLHTRAKILNLSKNSPFEISLFDKIRIFRVSFFTKFTFWKSHFSQNSHFQSLICHKIHFFKHQIPGNFWIKCWFLPQCGILYSKLPPKSLIEFISSSRGFDARTHRILVHLPMPPLDANRKGQLGLPERPQDTDAK